MISEILRISSIRLTGNLIFIGILALQTVSLAAQNSSQAPSKIAASPEFIEGRGFVLPKRRFVLNLNPGEYVSKIMVSKGQRVSGGQILARIENPSFSAAFIDLTAKINDHQVLLDDAEATRLELSLHRAGLERLDEKINSLKELSEKLPDYPIEKDMESLSDKKYELENQIKTASARLSRLEFRLKTQQGQLELLKKELEANKMRLEQNAVKAPFDGTIVERAIYPERLQPGDLVCELWDDSSFIVQMEVLQYQLSYLHAGQSAEIALDFGRDEKVQATLESVEPGSLVQESLGNQRFKAVLCLNRTVSWLRPGMQVVVRLRSKGTK